MLRPEWYFPTSAFGGKADINHDPAKGPLLAISGHLQRSTTMLFAEQIPGLSRILSAEMPLIR